MATHADAPPAPAAAAPQPLCDNLCWLLSRASYTLTTELTAAMEDLGVSPRAHAVLTAAAGGEHSQTELARMVGLDKTTMVVTLDELEAAGLAERRASPTDRRVRVIAVTAAGARKLAETAPGHVRVVSRTGLRTAHVLTGWALERGHELRGFAVSQPSLEDVYLRLTENKEASAR